MNQDGTTKKDGTKKWALFVLRWGIAVVGVYLVVSNLTLHDHVRVFNPRTHRPELVGVVGHPPEETWPLAVELPNGSQVELLRGDVLVKPDRQTVTMTDGKTEHVLGVQGVKNGVPARILVSESKSGEGHWILPEDVQGGYSVAVEYPAREIGLIRMCREADLKYLLGAVFVIPIVYLITGYRWWLLLEGLGVHLGLGRALQINMVGAFYNTFMPGSTGGDVLKAYYAAKNARMQRTRAVLSVVVDRAIGLMALIIMGGLAASFQWQVPECRRVAIAAGVITVGMGLAVAVLGYRPLRKLLGFDWIIGKLPMQEKVGKMIDTLRDYRSRPGLMAGTLAMSFPVHATVVVSAMFAGWAFGLPIATGYYWVVVPTVVLSGALPISPQGAGVMEFFAIILTQPRGATIGQAVALTLSIRLVQIVWNLAAGLLVLFGGYHAPTEAEQEDLEKDPPVGAGLA